MNPIDWKRKLSSSKLWAAIAGVITGLAMLFKLDESTISSVAGAVVSVASVVSYIVTEGKVDAESVKRPAGEKNWSEYSKEARKILRACIHKGENGRPGAPMWNRENKQILFVPGCGFTDPSYHLPHFYELFALWADQEDREFWKEAADASRKYLAKACHAVTGMNPEYGEFDGSPMSRKLPWGDKHDQFFSDAYRTAANIGLDCAWFGKDQGHYGAPLRLMRFLGTDLEAARCVYEVDGTPVEKTVLHPLGLLAATAQGALAVAMDDAGDGESDWGVAKQWVEWLWNQPLRKGERRYYDNCLYLFALLALSGNYRIY